MKTTIKMKIMRIFTIFFLVGMPLETRPGTAFCCSAALTPPRLKADCPTVRCPKLNPCRVAGCPIDECECTCAVCPRAPSIDCDNCPRPCSEEVCAANPNPPQIACGDVKCDCSCYPKGSVPLDFNPSINNDCLQPLTKPSKKRRKKTRAFIRQEHVGPTGLVITKPGCYEFAEDICFEPSSDGIAAIYIASNNVTIDMNGKKLSQCNDKQDTVGIIVNCGRSAVTIKNGSIHNFGALGAFVAKICSNITFKGLTVSGCGARGFFSEAINSFSPFGGGLALGGTTTDRITDIKIENCTVNINWEATPQNPSICAAAIGGSGVDDLCLNRVTTNIQLGPNNNALGITLSDATKVKVLKGTMFAKTGLTVLMPVGMLADRVQGTMVDIVMEFRAPKQGLGLLLMNSNNFINKNATITNITPNRDGGTTIIKGEMPATATVVSGTIEDLRQGLPSFKKTQVTHRALPSLPAVLDAQKMKKKGKKRSCLQRNSRVQQETLITQQDVGSTGFVITQPGTYILAEDICYTPELDEGAAITIRSTEVTLDLNGNRLAQCNEAANIVGIIIDESQHAVTIKNGTIANFSALGIFVSKGCTTISMNDLIIDNCGTSGNFGPATNSFGPYIGSIGLGGTADSESTKISNVAVTGCTLAL
nr:hypothetical protein [Candidatus Dependentiae bacterium]